MGSIGTEDQLREASAAPVENGAVGDQFPVIPDRVKKTLGQLNGDVPAAKLPNGHPHPVTKVADAPAPPIEYPTSAWRPKLELEDRGIDEIRPLRVVVVGAGLSGILAGILLPAKVPGLDLTIYEKNADVGGTWLENVYPGVRCDIPANVYQSTFTPRTQWSEKFAQGAEILQYWQERARKYDVYRYVKFNSNIQTVQWSDDEAKWIITVRDTETNEVFEDRADFFLTAIGRFNSWKLPDYPGLSDFKGVLRHTSNWDPSFDPKGKNVAVIGNGASGIQVVPNLQPIVNRLDHYARNKTWIAGSWAGDERTFEPQYYTPEELESFKDDETYLKYRKEMEAKYWRRFASTFRGSQENAEMRDTFIEIMRKRLAKKPELLDNLVPDFNPNCRRLTPGPGYLEAITQDNVNFIQTPIKRFTETGIETVDGKHREVDAIFCATGAHGVPQFEITARGVNLSQVWKPEGKYGFPYTYLGLATPGFPNLLYIAGPHGTGPSGTVPHAVEVQLTYYAKLLRKVSSQWIRTVEPSQQAADDFIEYCDAFFPKTVLTDNCSSWANGGKAGQRIFGIWPGSAAHVTIVRKEPRWEDWEYTYLSKSGNRFAYFGNGWTTKEADPNSDIASYLRVPSEIDLKDLHERWWDWP
ncbi:FAD-binding monooxygenase tazF [Exophiala dermatitidis]